MLPVLLTLSGVGLPEQPGNFPGALMGYYLGGQLSHNANFPTKTMTTKKPKSQRQRLLAYLKKNRKGITTMEAFRELGITCVHKRIADLEKFHEEGEYIVSWHIIRTPERTASGSIVTRYKLAR